MKRIGIIGAMAQEVGILVGQLDNAERYEHAGFVFHTGMRHGLEVVILQSGIGKVNAAVGTAILLERHHPDAIINTGSAGGLQAISTLVTSSFQMKYAIMMSMQWCSAMK